MRNESSSVHDVSVLLQIILFIIPNHYSSFCSLYLFLCVCLSFYIHLFIFISVSLYLSFSHSLYLCVSLSLSFSQSLYHSLSLSHSIILPSQFVGPLRLPIDDNTKLTAAQYRYPTHTPTQHSTVNLHLRLTFILSCPTLSCPTLSCPALSTFHPHN